MILTVKVNQFKKALGGEGQGQSNTEPKKKPISCGELHLVDLAGSEKVDMYTQVRREWTCTITCTRRCVPVYVIVVFFALRDVTIVHTAVEQDDKLRAAEGES
jgi:hypothetical protein